MLAKTSFYELGFKLKIVFLAECYVILVDWVGLKNCRPCNFNHDWPIHCDKEINQLCMRVIQYRWTDVNGQCKMWQNFIILIINIFSFISNLQYIQFWMAICKMIFKFLLTILLVALLARVSLVFVFPLVCWSWYACLLFDFRP